MDIRKLTLLSALMASTVVLPQLAQARAEVIVTVEPPAALYEVVPEPRTGYVWAPGYWHWNGQRHLWHSGYWVRHREGQHWVAHHWDRRGDRWYFVDGRWERG